LSFEKTVRTARSKSCLSVKEKLTQIAQDCVAFTSSPTSRKSRYVHITHNTTAQKHKKILLSQQSEQQRAWGGVSEIVSAFTFTAGESWKYFLFLSFMLFPAQRKNFCHLCACNLYEAHANTQKDR
jgi:hypothetical protein